MDRSKYPLDWEAFSRRIRVERAQGQCECAGECGADHFGRCEARHGGYRIVHLWQEFEKLVASHEELIDFFGCFYADDYVTSKIILTVAHLWKHGCSYTPPYCTNEQHVKAMCQDCHLRYDQPQRRANAARTRRRKKNNLELFSIE